jgi:hypothetical protein
MTNLSTARVTVSRRNGQQYELTKKTEIESSIMRANERKYHQTEGHGQIQKGAILKDLGVMGTGRKADEVLHGTYRPPYGTTHITKHFLLPSNAQRDIKLSHSSLIRNFVRGGI